LRKQPDNPSGLQRDSSGIPIIRADCEVQLFRKLGFCHARDRRGQMIFMRIVGQGRISELLESSAENLEADIFLRKMNWCTIGEDELNKLAAETRELCQAYCDGAMNSASPSHSLCEW
jgi:penicillin G amidase